MKQEKYICVSFSGGKDSTAMLLRMMELGEQIDEVICCDTYKEFPAMYRHIAKIKKRVESKGIKFTELRSKQSFDYLMFDHKVNRKNESLKGNLGYSCAGSRSRWCTSKLKIDVINQECFRLMGFDDQDFEKAQAVNSNSQLYKQAGNSIVVPVVENILVELRKAEII